MNPGRTCLAAVGVSSRPCVCTGGDRSDGQRVQIRRHPNGCALASRCVQFRMVGGCRRPTPTRIIDGLEVFRDDAFQAENEVILTKPLMSASKSCLSSKYCNNKDKDAGGKVFIPETLEDTDSESDSVGERRKVFNEGQSSKADGNSEQHWNMIHEHVEPVQHPVITKSVLEESEAVKESKMVENQHNSPEVFIPDDSIINTQDSMINEEEIETLKEELHHQTVDVKEEKPKKPQIRRSERLIKETTMTTKEKNERMAKKRNLEGLMKEEEKEMLKRGADDMMRIAIQLLAKRRATSRAILGAEEEVHRDGSDLE